MRSLAYFTICIILLLSLNDISAAPTEEKEGRNNIQWIKDIVNLPDSVIDGREFIFNRFGRLSKYNWSLLLKEPKGFHIYSGSVGNSEKQKRKFRKENFDTLKILKKYAKVINWGFDSLAQEAKKFVQKNDSSENFHFGFDLYVVNKNKIYFELKNIRQSFWGENSNRFRENLLNVTLLMVWFNSPDIRKHLRIFR